jgi:hypothetical protein
MKNNIKAEIIAHSKRAGTGDEIITYKLTFPRIILSEVNTYKMLEKNTSSCLSGNSLILVYDGKSFKEVQIKNLFENNNQNLKIVSFNEDYSFLLQDISKVFHSGVKPVYRITFYSGYCLDCTENHRLLKSNEYNNEFVTLKDFNIKQENGNVLIDSKIMNTYFVGIDSVQRRGYSYKNLQVDDSGNVYVSVNSSSSGIKYHEYEIYEPMRITNIEYLGEMDTYDIEVDGEYHNFIANGVVVHNSRAIPFEKMVEVVEKEPFVPIAWSKPHKGMQGTEYYTVPNTIESKIKKWLEARDAAVLTAKNLDIDTIEVKERVCLDYRDIVEDNYKLVKHETFNPVSKQLKNRILEPFMWVTQLCTGSRESFEHLFEQRCPIYELEVCPDSVVYARSKKEFIEHYDCFKDKDDLWWLQRNKGQAEIHFMDLAEKMYDALNESTPDELKEGDWHIPFQEEIWKGKQAEKLEDFIKMSCAMTARISYTTISDNEILTLEKAKNIYDKCVKSGHFSVVSHCAKCMTYEEYENWYKGFMKTTYYFDENGRQHRVMADRDFHKAKGYNKNLRGFISLRQYVEDGVGIIN